MPSLNAEMLVVLVPVNFIAIKSPGNMILSIFSNTAGSFSFTQANFAAVKFPGELSKCDRHCSWPMASKAALPIATALLSHQMMLFLNTC